MQADTPIFIGGAGRSGTTLLRLIFDSHSRIACGPELKVLPMICHQRRQLAALDSVLSLWGNDGDRLDAIYADLIRGLLEPYLASRGKPRVAEKSPNNVLVFDVLGRLFPESPLIHVIRDGRDVVASLLRQNWVDGVTGQPLAYTRDASEATRFWRQAVVAGRSNSGLPNYIEVRYEELVTTPEPTLCRLFGHIGERWEPDVLDYAGKPHDQPDGEAVVAGRLTAASIGRWSNELAPRQVEEVMTHGGKLLDQLGYLNGPV